jgi:hypothetical protein
MKRFSRSKKKRIIKKWFKRTGYFKFKPKTGRYDKARKVYWYAIPVYVVLNPNHIIHCEDIVKE